jgi:hypothetical protein
MQGQNARAKSAPAMRLSDCPGSKRHHGIGSHSTLCRERYEDAEVISLRHALRVATLSDSWREYFRERLRYASSPM